MEDRRFLLEILAVGFPNAVLEELAVPQSAVDRYAFRNAEGDANDLGL